MMWKLRNRACFEFKLVRSPAEFVCYACSFMRYWAGLYSDEDRVMLEEGADALQREVLTAHDDGRDEEGKICAWKMMDMRKLKKMMEM